MSTSIHSTVERIHNSEIQDKDLTPTELKEVSSKLQTLKLETLPAAQAEQIRNLRPMIDTRMKRLADAEQLVEAGAGLMILQKDLTPQSLLAAIQRLMQDRPLLTAFSQKVRGFHHENSAEEIADVLLAGCR